MGFLLPFLLTILFSSSVYFVSSVPLSAYVTVDSSSPYGVQIVSGNSTPPNDALAWGTYDPDTLFTTGWATLDLHMTTMAPQQNDTLAAYGVGFLEGYFTASEMYNWSINSGANQPNSKALQKFLDDNWSFMMNQIQINITSSYWRHVSTIVGQITGISDGQQYFYTGKSNYQLSFQTVYNAIILGGDIFNLAQVYGVSAAQAKYTPVIRRLLQTQPNTIRIEEESTITEKEPSSVVTLPKNSSGRFDHCSALIRVTPDNNDAYFTHTTWSGYESMLRIMKRYDLPFTGISNNNNIHGAAVPGRYTATSSYPGYGLYSSDDFYIMSSGIVSIETTINNDNLTLAKEYASTEVVLEWARNVLANRLGSDSVSWCDIFSEYKSGTYTNSWMIFNTNLFNIGKPLPPNTFVVLEEMPGNIRITDQSVYLNTNGFWSSYNVPSDPYIFNISGQQQLVDQYGGPTGPGAFYTFTNTSRARIFARDAPTVMDDYGLEAIIRYNNAPKDPLSTLGCGTYPPYSYTNAIADRSDLNDPTGNYIIPDIGYGDGGAIDAKYTKLSWIQAADIGNGELPLAYISGPTNTNVPTFSFLNTTLKISHQGLPDTYNFAWQRQPW